MPKIEQLIALFLFSFFPSAQERPNVLLIMADDLNDYIDAFGGTQM